jgi:hypothetical protein
VDNGFVRLAVLEQRVVRRVNATSLALTAKIEIAAHGALITSTNNRVHIAAITPDVAVHWLATLGRSAFSGA